MAISTTGLPTRLRVCHLSGDFPDPLVPAKTPVIRSLLDLTRDRFSHDVVAINRESPTATSFMASLLRGGGVPRTAIAVTPFAQGRAVAYEAPGQGLFHATMLRQLGDWLAGDLAARGGTDLLVGHKLTIEGIAVHRAAARLGIPYAVSIQGNTDARIIDARPDLRGLLARVFHEAAIVFPFAPWALAHIEARLDRRSGPVSLLPCPTELDEPLAPVRAGNGFLSVFHLHNHAGKNLRGMVAAMRLIAPVAPEITLAIVGGGEDAVVAQCRKVAAGAERVSFEGSLGREEVCARMNRATGLVLPSLSESFGLVFVEALFAGLPIVYPAGTAVDGYFDGAPFALRVNARDPREIAAAMLAIAREETRLKAQLADWQQSAAASRFARAHIARVFGDGLVQAAGGSSPARS